MPEMRTIDTGEVALRCAVEGEGPLVIMVHGFPESWYSWRHQIGPVADAGFTACAIDVRGYGGSDKPEAIEDYALEKIVGDLERGTHRPPEPGVPPSWCIVRAAFWRTAPSASPAIDTAAATSAS